MTLAEIWASSPGQISGKHIRQVIGFCGSGSASGKLRDGGDAAAEFRDFLARIPSDLLGRFADECLKDSFEGSGLVLQDLINQAGRRLGFAVTDGRYAGTQAHVGFDGLWRFPDSRVLLVEVKTTDAYSVNLNRIAGYRRTLIERSELVEEGSSVLIIVGRQDTGNLEAQIQGSRHAWDIRLISVDALLRLMRLKEEVEDPKIVRRIWEILVPHEFTKLDDIIEVVFSTAEDVRESQPMDDEPPPDERVDETAEKRPKFIPVAFNEACAARVQMNPKTTLIRRSRAQYSSSDEGTRLVCAVARELARKTYSIFWFAFHPHQREFLEAATSSFVAFGCGSPSLLILIPFPDFLEWLPNLNKTELEDREYWHVQIRLQGGRVQLHQKEGAKKIDVTRYVLQ